MPRFTQPQQSGNLYIVGNDWGPTSIPMSSINVGYQYSTYQDLYSFAGPDGQAIRTMYSGSYGTLVPARRRY